MSSIDDLTATLEAEHARAREAFDLSVEAIATIGSVASWTITGLAVLVAVVALAGWWTIYKTAKFKAEKVAKAQIDAYLKSDGFGKLVQQQVAFVISEIAISAHATEDRDEDDEDPFPQG